MTPNDLRPPLRRAGRLSARLATLLLALLLSTGCGDSSSDFVYTGTNGDGAQTGPQTGALSFNFVKGQAALEVPQSTTDIRFAFFDGPDGTGNPSQPT